MCRPSGHHLSRQFYQLSIYRFSPTLPDPSTILPIASPIGWIEWHSVTTLPGNVNSRHICTTLMCTWFYICWVHPSLLEYQAHLFLESPPGNFCSEEKLLFTNKLSTYGCINPVLDYRDIV